MNILAFIIAIVLGIVLWPIIKAYTFLILVLLVIWLLVTRNGSRS